MDLSNLIYLLIIVLVVFSQLKSMKKKTKEASTVDSDMEPDSSDVDEMLRQLLEQEVIEPVYVKEQHPISEQPTPAGESKYVSARSQADAVPSPESPSALQEHKGRAGVAIRTREDLKKAIIYSEIIRRKY